MSVKYPQVEVPLSGEDGNIYYIAGRVLAALRTAGVGELERHNFSVELSGTKNYDAALQCVMRWVATT